MLRRRIGSPRSREGLVVDEVRARSSVIQEHRPAVASDHADDVRAHRGFVSWEPQVVEPPRAHGAQRRYLVVQEPVQFAAGLRGAPRRYDLDLDTRPPEQGFEEGVGRGPIPSHDRHRRRSVVLEDAV
jgi:hypothetical protein